jgi:hypothetical protein
MSDGPVTPYASFSTASRELASNGGAWFVAINSEVIGATTIISHQSMGGMTELIQLTSAMGAWLDIPSSVAQIGDITSGYVSFLPSSIFQLSSVPHYTLCYDTTTFW